MPRARYQRGTLQTSVRAHGSHPERKLPRGQYWSMWYRYVRLPDGGERRQQREKIITRELAESLQIATDYAGALTKADAQRVLDLLIAQDAGTYTPPDTQATVAMVAREYLALMQPNWGDHMVRTAGNLIEKHIIDGKIANRHITSLSEADLQRWINEYVDAYASRSLLKGLLLHLRGIWKLAQETDHTRQFGRGSPGEEQEKRLRTIPFC